MPLSHGEAGSIELWYNASQDGRTCNTMAFMLSPFALFKIVISSAFWRDAERPAFDGQSML